MLLGGWRELAELAKQPERVAFDFIDRDSNTYSRCRNSRGCQRSGLQVASILRGREGRSGGKSRRKLHETLATALLFIEERASLNALN